MASMASGGFHALPSVAPLKRTLLEWRKGGYCGFHALPSVAPLKREPLRHRRHGDGVFPRSTERGPIEAFRRLGISIRISTVSTLYRAWPH